MQPLDAVYLQILKNLCTDLSEPVPLDGVDPSALYRLAEKHCSLPFLLPYFEQQPQFSALKQQTKQMLLSLKGHQSRRQLSHSRISEAGRSGSLYSRKRCFFPCLPDS